MKLCLSRCGLLLAVAAFSFSSCVVQRQVPFNEADFQQARGTGSGSVTGRCFAIMEDKSERVAVITEVDLSPVNPYFTEVTMVNFARNRKLSPGDPRAQKYVRTATSDSDGKFEFRHLPPGDYYVTTSIDWTYHYFDVDSNQVEVQVDIPLYARVTVRNGQTTVAHWTYGRRTAK